MTLEQEIREDIGNGLLPVEIIEKHKITPKKFYSIHKAIAKVSIKFMYSQNVNNMALELELYLDNAARLRRRTIDILDSYKAKDEIPPLEYIKLIMDLDNHTMRTKSETIQAINLMGLQAHQIMKEKDGSIVPQKREQGIA